MTTTSALSIAYVIHRIERAPNVRCLVAAYDAAIEGSTLSIHRKRGSEWAVWHGEYAGLTGTFAEVRAHLAAQAEEILDREAANEIASAPAKPAMVQQVAQQQQGRDMRASKPATGEIRVAALGHLGSPCDPNSTEASLWIVTDGKDSRDFASLEEAEAYAAFCEGLGYIPAREDEPVMVQQQSQQQQACAAAPAQHPPGAPTNAWLDAEVHAFVAGVIAELMPDEDEASPRPQVSALEVAELDAFVATKGWIALFERECAGSGSVPFGDLFDARQAMQAAHARLDAFTMAAV